MAADAGNGGRRQCLRRAFGVVAGLGLLLAGALVHAQSFVPVPTAVGGVHQTVAVGSELPERFVLRVTDPQGQPMAGVRVVFAINFCLEGVPPPGGGCPPPTLYGQFVNATGPSEAVSDAAGLATSAAFVAGSTTGQYSVYSSIPAQQVGSVQIPFNTAFRLFNITQVPSGVAPLAFPIPVNQGWALAALVVLLLYTAQGRLRRRA